MSLFHLVGLLVPVCVAFSLFGASAILRDSLASVLNAFREDRPGRKPSFIRASSSSISDNMLKQDVILVKGETLHIETNHNKLDSVLLVVGPPLAATTTLQPDSTPTLPLQRSNTRIISSMKDEQPHVKDGSALPMPPFANRNKSYFVLHVGPPKTATTTLQLELKNFTDIL